jgi:alpha-tubulin suppressor-like RCC1 family protein
LFKIADGDVCIVGGNEKAMGIGEQYPVLSWTRPVLERNINSDLPRKVSEIGAGYLSSYARFATGEYMFWGNNLHQQLHINPSGTEIYEPFPMVIEDTALDGRKINKIIMGYNDAFALVKRSFRTSHFLFRSNAY